MNTRIRIIPWVMLVVGFILVLQESPNCIPCVWPPGIAIIQWELYRESKPRRVIAIVNPDTILR